MNGPELFLAAVALGALCTFTYVLGAARTEARSRRADWRCQQLIKANEQVCRERDDAERENAELRDYLQWDRQLEDGSAA